AWELLAGLGYETDGLYLGRGIGGHSDASGRYARELAAARGLKPLELHIPADSGFDTETAAATVRRPPCGACGLSKRHLFNQAALDGGYDAVATGHNLDDEAA